MVPTTATSQSHQQSGPSSVIPPPPLPPPSVGPTSPASHPPQHHQQQTMSAPFPPPPHRPQQQGSGLGPGSSSYPMPPQSPSTRGIPGSIPPSRNHQGPAAAAPYHHPLHSPAQPQRQGQHHSQHQQVPRRHSAHIHPAPQNHHSSLEPPQQQQMRHRSHHHHQQAQQQHKGQAVPKPSHPSSSAAVGHQPQGQGHYLPTGLNGDWQSDKDMQHRREMIQHIVRLLKQKDKNASQEWLNKLPQMVKQLEVSLYRSAPSFEAYADTSTLKHRLQLLAMEIARKTQQSKSDQRDGTRRSEPQRQPRQLPNGLHSSQHQNVQRPGSRGISSPFMGPTPSSSPQIQSPHSTNMTPSHDQQHKMSAQRHQMSTQRNRPQQQRGNDRRQVVNVDDINPMMGGNGSTAGASGGNSSQVSHHSPGGPNGSSSNNFLLGSVGDSSGMRNSGSSSQQGNKNDPEWQLRIRHKQQRLLLLHHASKCPHEGGKCTVTAHCADMKRLWKHMARCTDNNCRVSHCFSSRSILSHYRKCKDPQCPACGPVRETVKKAQTKSGAGSSMNSSSRVPPPRNNNGIGPAISPVNAASNIFPSTGAPSSATAMPTSSQHPSARASSADNMGAGSLAISSRPGALNGMNTCAPVYSGNSVSSPSSSYRGGSEGNGHQQPTSSTPHSAFRDRDSAQSALPGVGFSSRNSTMSNGSSGGTHHSAGQQNDPEWKSKIRHKQQRLLLLRHASKCPYPDGQCKVTPHCASMKRLWKHISDCKDQHCKVQHCMSSRYVLSHYRRCKDARCPACGPVRETIRNKRDRDLSVGNLNPAADLELGYDAANEKQNRNLAVESDASLKPRSLTPPASSDTNIGASEIPSSEDIQQHANKRPKTDPEHVASGENSLSSSFAPSDLDVKPVVVGSEENGVVAVCQPIETDANQEIVSSEKSEPPPPPPPPPPVEKPEPSATVESPKPPAAVPVQKGSEDCSFSLIQSFTIEQIETHIASLNRTVQLAPSKLKGRCLEILKGLQTHNHGWVFNYPVDPVELGLPDYFDVIKRPMDLGTIQKKLESGSYHSIDEFNADARLTFDNAMTYNEVGSVVHGMAKELKDKFLEDCGKFMEQLKGEEEARRKNERACSLCGCEKLLFEPPVFFCNGLNCPSKRIRRNSHFYVGGSSQYFWCNQCYNELDEKTQIELGDMSLKKSDLKKKKNDEVHEESWVQCDTCERWIHQICGLFNTRQNKENKSEYSCPQCLLDRMKQKPVERPRTKTPSAEDLPKTKLSEWLETHVRKKVNERFETLATDTENISLGEAANSLKIGGTITIRQVTSTDRKLEVRERMKRRYASKNYPDEFPFRCKCIVVFQHLDGVDVILFALYVYEHGENNPPPNQRTVYISYLDSVHFMRPRKLRTFVYHEILIAYLDYARKKGFSTAHIWACPPLKGDDYIFYAKPEDQKTPKDNRLRQWYVDMLEECQRRSIVGKVTNMYDLYFANEKIDATAVPYMEGDYFPGEAENIIKDLEEGRGSKNSGKKSKKKKSSSNGGNSGSGNKLKSKKTGRGGTRSAGLEEEPPNEPTEVPVKSQKESTQDPVMVKLGETIHPMKESFIVAFLNWAGAKEEDMVVPKEVVEYREKMSAQELDSNVAMPDAIESNVGVVDEVLSRKRDADGNPRPVSISSLNSVSGKGVLGRRVKIIDDDLEELDCEFFNNRQAFLNLCRGNHYQFDELRRAKHTSMMVLWHLHNRDAPKFVQQCASCSREILSGKRYHCSVCTDFDLCEECYKNPQTNRGSCSHKLEPIAVEGDNNKGGKNKSGCEMTEEQRKERQRNIQLHIQLIEHASRCTSSECKSSNCAKMKNYLKHGSTCKVKASGGCKICKRIWTLLRIHAQNCKVSKCPMPQCNAIRERIRQLAKQQQAMDDRRRQEMNRHYRHGSDSR